jgi:hypothetical protein
MTVDVSAFRQGSPYAEQALATANDNGRAVHGMSKLVQRFVLELMTLKDGVPMSKQGCDFVARLQNGVASETDVFLIFSSSLSLVQQRLESTALASDPPEERLLSVKILRLTLATGTMSLDLRLRNRSNQTSVVTIPLNFVLN